MFCFFVKTNACVVLFDIYSSNIANAISHSADSPFDESRIKRRSAILCNKEKIK